MPPCIRPVARALALASALVVGVASAQAPQAPPATLPNPLQYTSVISGYQAYADAPVQSWREANDRVGRIGGWRAYAKEIQGRAPAGEAPVADPHAGHATGAKP